MKGEMLLVNNSHDEKLAGPYLSQLTVDDSLVAPCGMHFTVYPHQQSKDVRSEPVPQGKLSVQR